MQPNDSTEYDQLPWTVGSSQEFRDRVREPDFEPAASAIYQFLDRKDIKETIQEFRVYYYRWVKNSERGNSLRLTGIYPDNPPEEIIAGREIAREMSKLLDFIDVLDAQQRQLSGCNVM